MAHTPRINKAYLSIALNLAFAPPEQLFEGISIQLSDIGVSSYIGVSDAIQLIQNLNRYSAEPNYAAIFGAHLGAASHGPVGYATLSAPTLGKALSTFLEWFHIRAEVYHYQVIERHEYFEIIIEDTTDSDEFKVFFFEAFMRAFEVIIAYILGHTANGQTIICFETDANNRQSLMREEYESSLRFSENQNRLLVPKDFWYSVSPLFDKDSFEFNVAKCQQLMDERELDKRIDLQVRHLLRKHYEKAVLSAAPIAAPTQKQLCSLLYVSERTLIRKLRELKTSFRQILEEEHKRWAEQLLNQSKYTVYDVAQILGYSESANFCRAFKKWFGMSPTKFRQRGI